MKQVPRPAILVVVSLFWLAVVAFGTGALLKYSSVPNPDSMPPAHWPTSSAIPHSTDKPTLVMFAHPQCPCTRASISDLAELMAHCQGRVDTRVVFLHPTGSREDWTHSDLWRSAEEIPGVTVQADENGAEARLFHAATSGHTVLYDTRGELVFDGGITASRGHAGDNDGSDAIVALLNNQTTKPAQTPVYGCLILDHRP